MDSADESHSASVEVGQSWVSVLKVKELLSHVLNQLDLDSLQNSRLVSKFWNETAAQVLFSCCWITGEPTPIGRDHRFANYQRFQSVLSTSADPSEFFRRFAVTDRYFLWTGNSQHLSIYGKYLKAVRLQYFGVGRHAGYSMEFLIHQILNECSPQLEELWVSDEEPQRVQVVPPAATVIPKLSGPLNLVHVDLSNRYQSDIPPGREDFYLEMLKLSSKLVKLGMNFGPADSDSFCKKLWELRNITQGLRSFSWRTGGRRALLQTEVISSIKFSEKLHTLRIHDAQLDPRDPTVQRFLGSIPNLKTLEWIRYSAVDRLTRQEEIEAKGQLLPVLIQKLSNLEKLVVTCDSAINHFSLFEGVMEIKNVNPDNKLKALANWGCERSRRISNPDSFDLIVNYFPNLTTLALKVEVQEIDDGVGIRKVAEVIKGLMSLSNLKKLCLDVDLSVTQEDVSECFRYLTVFLNLTRFALVCDNVGQRTPVITFTPSLQAPLLALKHLSHLRLIGFQIAENGREGMLDFVKMNRIPFECYRGYVFKDRDDYLHRTLLTDQLSSKTFLR